MLGPTTSIAKNLPITIGSDGTWSYTWDTSKVPVEVYFVRASIKDGNGVVTYTDSRYALAVYRPEPTDAGAKSDGGTVPSDGGAVSDLAAPSDFATTNMPPRSRNCAVGGAAQGGAAPASRSAWARSSWRCSSSSRPVGEVLEARVLVEEREAHGADRGRCAACR